MESQNFSNQNGTIFIGSEDEDVINEAILWAKLNNWQVHFTNFFDSRRQTAAVGNEFSSTRSSHVHDNLEYLSMMLNLPLLVKSGMCVCTLTSNFCQLVDEFRVTVGGKANQPTLDISPETCEIPPCGYGLIRRGQKSKGR